MTIISHDHDAVQGVSRNSLSSGHVTARTQDRTSRVSARSGPTPALPPGCITGEIAVVADNTATSEGTR
jgi:hypothetical protein